MVHDVNPRIVLAEEVGLLHGGVTVANDRDGAIPKDGDDAVADGASGDAAIPEVIGPGTVDAAGDGADGDDEGIHLDGVGGGDDVERARADDEIDGGDGLGEDVCRSRATGHDSYP